MRRSRRPSSSSGILHPQPPHDASLRARVRTSAPERWTGGPQRPSRERRAAHPHRAGPPRRLRLDEASYRADPCEGAKLRGRRLRRLCRAMEDDRQDVRRQVVALRAMPHPLGRATSAINVRGVFRTREGAASSIRMIEVGPKSWRTGGFSLLPAGDGQERRQPFSRLPCRRVPTRSSQGASVLNASPAFDRARCKKAHRRRGGSHAFDAAAVKLEGIDFREGARLTFDDTPPVGDSSTRFRRSCGCRTASGEGENF